jgi:hypothetical protein
MINERIALLALKASDPKTGWLDRQKFAQLIIEQCGIVGDNWVDNEDSGTNRISDKLKEHFGVE